MKIYLLIDTLELLNYGLNLKAMKKIIYFWLKEEFTLLYML